MYNPNDYFPPTFVRDWRQLFHNKGYLILMALVYVIAWMALCTTDWADIAQKMVHAYEPVNCEYTNAAFYDNPYYDAEYTHHHYESCYPISDVIRKMRHLNIWHAFCAMGLVALLIPLRVGGSVSADTRVKGTNFLQVTPLSSWRIVGGMWLSSFSQVLVAAVLAVPLILMRAAYMPTGNEADWYGLFYTVLAGGVFSAAYMFICGLKQLLRFSMMAGLIGLGIAAVQAFCYSTCLDPACMEPWIPALHTLAAALVTLMFLQLARRPYAAPAENTSLGLRITVLACIVVGLACLWGYMETEPPYEVISEPDGYTSIRRGDPTTVYMPGFVFTFPTLVLILSASFGALMDAILPLTSLPVHAKRTLRWLPAWPQVPGVLQSVLFLLLPLMALAVPMYFVATGYTCGVVVDFILSTGNYAGTLISMYLATALLMWGAATISILLGDLVVRRNSPWRPLVMPLAFGCLSVVCVIFAVSSGAIMGVPVINIGGSLEAWTEFCYSFNGGDYTYDFTTGDFPMEDINKAASDCFGYCCAAIVESLVAFVLLAVRVTSSRQRG